MKRLAALAGTAFLAVTCWTVPAIDLRHAPLKPGPHLHLSHRPGERYATALNWAGYWAEKLGGHAANSVLRAHGGWAVPPVTCGFMEISSAASWVGIDGVYSPTVEQVGTTSRCTMGIANYSTWYEMYPSAAVSIPVAVAAGDQIEAYVENVGGNGFQVTLVNRTTNQSFATTATQAATASRDSAEWILEAPSTIFGSQPLANFGTAHYAYSAATIDGHDGVIDSPNFLHDQLVMAASDGTVKAQPSALSLDGQRFSVVWKHS